MTRIHPLRFHSNNGLEINRVLSQPEGLVSEGHASLILCRKFCLYLRFAFNCATAQISETLLPREYLALQQTEDRNKIREIEE
jgi:hypothetical protein